MANLGSHNRYEGRIYTEKRKSVSFVKKRERRDAQVYSRTTEKRVH